MYTFIFENNIIECHDPIISILLQDLKLTKHWFSSIQWVPLQEAMNEICATFRPPITIFLMAGALTISSVLRIRPTVGSTVRYALRNESNLQTVPAMPRQCYESFLPSTTRMYNALSDEIKNSSSLEVFKAILNRNTVKPPIYYYAGSRLGQIYHTRLRLKCSSLHQHLFLK